MSTLVLVRHAQASLFADDYDRLSDTGEVQARRLGDYWTRRRFMVDAVFTGPRQRQRRTAEIVGNCYTQAGLAWPEAVALPELDEHEAVNLLTNDGRGQFHDQPHVQRLAQAFHIADDPEEKFRRFQKLFEGVIMLWSEGSGSGVETWLAFRDRVRTGIRRMTGGDRGRRVAAFTSAGPITVGLQMALECPDQTALGLGWRLRNCSLSEFVFTAGRFSLDSYNALPHLDDASLWTHL
jgi:broad specificity phosphatase PhoE